MRLLVLFLLVAWPCWAQEDPISVVGEFRVYRNHSGYAAGRTGQTRIHVVGTVNKVSEAVVRKFKVKAVIVNPVDGQVIGQTAENVHRVLNKGRPVEFEYDWYTPPALDNHPAFVVQIVYLYQDRNNKEYSGLTNLRFNEDPNYVPVNR